MLLWLRRRSFVNKENILLCKKRNEMVHKQTSRGVLSKRCSENMRQIYRRTPMPKCVFNFIENPLWHGCSLVNLPHIFRIPFPKSTSEWLLLMVASSWNACEMNGYGVGAFAKELLPQIFKMFNPFLLNSPFLYRLRTSENLTVFRG